MSASLAPFTVLFFLDKKIVPVLVSLHKAAFLFTNKFTA